MTTTSPFLPPPPPPDSDPVPSGIVPLGFVPPPLPGSVPRGLPGALPPHGSVPPTSTAPVPGPPTPDPAPVGVAPTHDEIARLAFQIWRDKGEIPGSADENWLAAERILYELAGL